MTRGTISRRKWFPTPKAATHFEIPDAEIPGPGFHWYNLGEVTLTGHDYLYLFWSWIIKTELHDSYDPKTPDSKYEVWADLKFEGPAFLHAKAGDENAISVERIVLVKK